jgi:hypothetical protein
LNSEVELPDYRKPPAVLQINGFNGAMQVTGQDISPRWLPAVARNAIREEVPLTSSVGEIEAMLQRAEADDDGCIKLSLPMGQDLVALMNSERQQPLARITAVYWSLSAPALAGVLDRIRTTLVELVAEMRAGMPESAETPSPEVADQAVNVVIHGRGHNVNVTTVAASGSGSHEVNAQGVIVDRSVTLLDEAWPGLREELAELGVADDELEQLHTALLTDGDLVNGELGPAAVGWVGRLTTRVTSGAATLAGGVSVEALTQVILKALGLA